MYGTEGQNAKWNKLDVERQVVQDTTFMRNLK